MESNNTTAVMPHVITEPSGDADGSTFFYVDLVLKMYLNPALGVCGIFINLVNTVIFYRMGVSDGVTQNFLILSVFDGVLAVAATINSACNILLETVAVLGGRTALNLQAVFWTSVVVWPFSQIVSCTTTTVIAVVRCCCVTLPLRVKQVLTPRRQLTAIVVFSAAFDGVLTYAFSGLRFTRINDPRTNIFSVFLIGIDYDTLNVFTNVFFYVTFIIVVGCLIILSVNLSRATKFRDLSTSSTANPLSEKSKEKSRETRVVQTVTLVSAIFIAYNIPAITLSVIRQVVDGFSSRGHLRNLYGFFITLTETTLLLNVDVNIFIYFSYNSRYRSIFNGMFASSSRQKQKY